MWVYTYVRENNVRFDFSSTLAIICIVAGLVAFGLFGIGIYFLIFRKKLCKRFGQSDGQLEDAATEPAAQSGTIIT